MGISLPFDWRAVNAFSARLGFGVAHDEDGNPLVAMAGHPEHVEERDDEMPPVRADSGVGG